jgi:hypothetical protein
MKNLDFLCMQAAQTMVAGTGEKTAKENLATKALGVLLQNGPYGMVLYLQVQKKDKDIAAEFREQLLTLIRNAVIEPAPPSSGNFSEITKWLQKTAANLDTYLFVKRLWQQTLTYARYHAKAVG